MPGRAGADAGLGRWKDINEPLGRVLDKARLNVELAPVLENLIVLRPMTYVPARHVSLIASKAEAFELAAKVAGRSYLIREPKVSKQATSALITQDAPRAS